MRLHAMLIATAFVGACSSKNHVPSSAAIRDSLVAAGARGARMISAQQFAPGQWTELFVVSPYTPSASIRRCFVGDRRIDEHDIVEREDITLLVFRFSDGDIQSRAVPRAATGFGPDTWSARYAASATFQVVPGDQTTGAHLVPVAGRLGRCV